MTFNVKGDSRLMHSKPAFSGYLDEQLNVKKCACTASDDVCVGAAQRQEL